MHAAVIDEAGAAPRYAEFKEPEPIDGESVMTVLAAGIHPIVRSLASGAHYGSDDRYPKVPGVDCVARDEHGVARYAGFIRSPWGTIAERIAVRSGVPIPDGADAAAIAGSMNPGLSSWLPLVARTREVERLGTVVVVGATGVAGRIAVQNAFALGAERVVGLGRDAHRLTEVAALGGVPVALQDGPDALLRALEGTAPSVVLDFAWGSAAELVWEALAGRGLAGDGSDIVHVEIGATAGPSAALPAALLRSRRFAIRGSGAGSAPLAEILAQLPVLMSKVASGEIVAPIRTFPLSQIDRAWAYTGPDRAVVVID